MDFAGRDGGRVLSTHAKRMYGAIARQEWEFVDILEREHPGTRNELLEWGLISDEKRPAVRDPKQAIDLKMARELDEARHRVALLSQMPALSADLDREYTAIQLRIPGGSSVYLAEPETVNARLQDVVGSARREILAAQPAGPRKREVLAQALGRDQAALDRGVEMRTIYRSTVRSHPVTAEYVRALSTRPGGRPAKYGTVDDDFERMIIVDREKAFITNHVVAGAPEHAAWLVSDPAVVAVLARMFDSKWRRAQPWNGELRARTGGVDTVSGADGARTSAWQRAIMRHLCDGASQPVTARRMDISKRKLEEEIAALKALWGVRTLNELIFQYALSPDRLVDDSAAAENDGAPVDVTSTGAVEAA